MNVVEALIIKDEIAYLEYGKKYEELSEDQKLEIQYILDDLL